MARLVDTSAASFWLAASAIAFNPTFWNIAARQEYHNKTITRLFRGNALYGCYALAITIFSLGIIRDLIFEYALRTQPTHALLTPFPVKLLAAALLVSGNVLVLTSMYALGITGTYLGDYFGILMDERVTSFPFNVTDAPMYNGSVLSFIGSALWLGKPAGLLLAAEVAGMYWIARRFEDPFTTEIYAKRDRERARQGVETKKTT